MTYLSPTPTGATFSECERYRFTLWRRWAPGLLDDPQPLVAFIGLNPSTADESVDDPTIRRCIGFAKRWGYGGMVMLNCFAFRATDPKDMKAHDEPLAMKVQNMAAILDIAKQVGSVVCCWGVHGSHLGRDELVRATLHKSVLTHLGLTKGGQPKHPLYLRKDTERRIWS